MYQNGGEKVKDKYSISENIKQLVKVFPPVTTNYNLLHYYYWTIYDKVNSLEDIVKATPAESIRRNFQRLVQIGEIKVPSRVRAARQEKEAEYRHEFAGLY